ncbi:transcriptional regulator, GntR family [Bacillus sp. OK048]|nr:transcriptional regulator, GntR family [Bacillus sp. OK048]
MHIFIWITRLRMGCGCMSRIIKPGPLHIQAYNIMKKQFLEGQYEPGERIIELQFAEKLGISRGPLREAIRMLMHDGLLIQDDRSVHLFKPTLEDIIEVFQCREYLELLAVRLASKNMTGTLQQKLSLNIQNLREAVEKNSKKDISAYDQEFHDLIIYASKNKQLIELMTKIQIKITYMRNNIFRNYHTRLDFTDEHKSIFQALVDNDIAKAEEEMRNHIESNLNFIIQANNNDNSYRKK